jgi:Raf kinase inhibitor-like YbhB/YbcL family protein
MWTRLAPALLIALASCGAARKDNQMNENVTVARFALTSSDIRDGQPIPAVHSCDGSNQSPALTWDEPPTGTKSLALIMDDPDAPSGTFRHWGAYDIPPTTRSIPAGSAVGKQATNSFGNSGYGGPCPPKGHGPHHYRFKLYALDVDSLAVPADAKVEQVEAEAQKHQVGLAELTGTFERK